MIRIDEKSFGESGITTAPQRLFVSQWAELFCPDTIDMYSVRVANALSVLVELAESIEEKLDDETSSEHLKYLAEEAIWMLDDDLIIQKHHKAPSDFLMKRLKQAKESNKNRTWANVKTDIKLLKDEATEKYRLNLLDELTRLMGLPKVDVELPKLIELLATQCIIDKFSLEYLDDLRKEFLDSSTSRTFTERWEKFGHSLTRNQRAFDVYFMLSWPPGKGLIQDAFRIEIKTTLDGYRENFSRGYLNQGKSHICHIRDISASDNFSATREAHKLLSALTDQLVFEYRALEKPIPGSIAAVKDISANVLIDTTYESKRAVKEKGKQQSLLRRVKYLQDIFHGNSRFLDSQSCEKIINSFRYSGISFSTPEAESKFLHSWIALEYLLKTETRGSVITPIVENVPKIVSLNYCMSLLKDLSANLRRLRVSETKILELGISQTANKNYSILDLYSTLRDTAKRQSLSEICSNPLMKYRIEELGNVFSSFESIRRSLNNYHAEMKWQIQRMYRIRNKIAHSAVVGLNLIRLQESFETYYRQVMESLLYKSSLLTTRSSLIDVINQISSKFDLADFKLQKGINPVEILPET